MDKIAGDPLYPILLNAPISGNLKAVDSMVWALKVFVQIVLP
jgi:hypothetical protein